VAPWLPQVVSGWAWPGVEVIRQSAPRTVAAEDRRVEPSGEMHRIDTDNAQR